jgi:phospholipase/carboxylesterase
MPGDTHRNRPVVTWGADLADARVAVVAVHGRGQSPEFMSEAAREITAPGLRYYAPHAEGDSWYPQPFMAPIAENEPALTDAIGALLACLHGVEKDGFTARQTVLWGFSQGACLVSQLMVSEPVPVAGLLIFTGGYVGERYAGTPEQALAGTPVVVRSVEQDPWVPAGRVRETAQILRAMGASVDLHIEAGDEHVITVEATAAASRMLEGIRGRADPA